VTKHKAPDRPGKVIEVEWLDSVSLGRWATKEEHLTELQELVCRSTGYLLQEDDVCLTLVQSLNTTGHLANSISIPKAAILLTRTLAR